MPNDGLYPIYYVVDHLVMRAMSQCAIIILIHPDIPV